MGKTLLESRWNGQAPLMCPVRLGLAESPAGRLVCEIHASKRLPFAYSANSMRLYATFDAQITLISLPNSIC